MSVGPVRMTFAVLLIIVGIVSFIVILVTSLSKIFSGLERVGIPGARELALEPGDYTIYWESDSRFGSVPSRSDLDLAVVSKGDGSVLPVTSSIFLAGRYSTLDRVGSPFAAFRVERADLYAVKAAAASGKTLPKGGLAVGRRLGFLGILKIVLILLVVVGASVGSGVALLVRKPS